MTSVRGLIIRPLSTPRGVPDLIETVERQACTGQRRVQEHVAAPQESFLATSPIEMNTPYCTMVARPATHCQ